MKRSTWMLCFLVAVTALSSKSHAQNQAFEGQLKALSEEILTFHKTDRLHKDKKMRLVKVEAKNVPDAGDDQRIREGLATHLNAILDDNAKLQLKIDWTYKQSETKTNAGKKVIEIRATICLEDGRPIPLKTKIAEVDSIVREVNNSTDIARLIGATLAPPDTQDHATRLNAIFSAFEKPQFSTPREKTRIAAVGQSLYAVELVKRVGNRGAPMPIIPDNHNGMAFASIAIGDTYEIVLYNYDEQADAVAKLEIDGLDVANAFNKDIVGGAKVPGYFIPRATNGNPGTHTIKGWLHTIRPGNDNVYQFVVDELGKGAAASKKVEGKVGLVTAQFFDAYGPNERPKARNFGATAVGKPIKVDLQSKPCQIGDQAVSVVTIRYSREPQGELFYEKQSP